jgi:hypothetical protein
MVTFLESRVDQCANVFGREAGRPSPFDEPPHQADDLVAIGGLPLPHGPTDDAHAVPADQFDHSVPLQERISFGDRHRIDGQLAGYLPDGRQEVSVRQSAGRNLRPHLIENLPVDRHARTRRDMKPKPPLGWHMCIIVSIHVASCQSVLCSVGRVASLRYAWTLNATCARDWGGEDAARLSSPKSDPSHPSRAD